MNPLSEIIRREIAVSGVIPFARFMELALYCPQLGYYERKPDNVGQRGDFYTSVSVGDLFGRLLAMQMADWLEGMAVAQIVEAGAHDGRLAADILSWIQSQRPQLFQRIEYIIVEPSAERRGWQGRTLKALAPRVRWVGGFAGEQFSGIIFSNELLDAFPVHRYGWDAAARCWFEWGVAVENEQFVWRKIGDCRFRTADSELEAALPDEFTVEVSFAAQAWWRQAVNSITAGKLCTIDYGLAAEELFRPECHAGTLRAYHRHQVSTDVLANVGEQDLTAHVDFTALQTEGETAGLRTEIFTTQARFFTDIAGRAWKNPATFGGEWTPALTRQFQTLTHPEFLGRAFRVLVQSR